jgi:hypothetical protein
MIIKLDRLSEDDDLLTVVVASLTAVLLVSLVIFFTVGFICGQWFDRKFKEPFNQASGAQPSRGPLVCFTSCNIAMDNTIATQS